MEFQQIIEAAVRFMDFAGVAVMVVGAVVSIPMAMRGYHPRRPHPGADNKSVYRSYRQLLGRSILLGLELLVAADIIRTVAITPTFEGVGVLAIIVLVRTFLSFSLELEITGRWPWQKEYLSEDGAPGRRQKPESAALYHDGSKASPGKARGPAGE
ncbi:putative membrane protein [Arthrobacter pascens]|nr:putative membrane protein [Arthrobacter pascens]